MADPSVAVVIPVYRQPSRLVDALESVLRQKTDCDYRIVLVNDGCPFEETDEVCRTYARRHPERVRYLRLAHRGLASARNAGAEFARQAWPELEAVQFLNADDWLSPRSIQAGLDALRSHSDAAWAGPDGPESGICSMSADSDRRLPKFESLVRNDAAHPSMIGRNVWERGLRFDESVNAGMEDWNFALQCLSANVPGIRVPAMDLRHRELTDPGVRPADPAEHATASQLRRKHESWCTPRLALELEHEESPRFAIYLIDEDRILFTSDPALRDKSIATRELGHHLVQSRRGPRPTSLPPYFVVTSAAFLRVAHHGRFASGLFWLMQCELMRSPAAMMGATLVESPGTEYAYEVLPPSAPRSDGPPIGLAILRTRTLLEYFKSGGAHVRRLIAAPNDDLIRIRDLRYTHLDVSGEARADALAGLAALVEQTSADLAVRRVACSLLNDDQFAGAYDGNDASRRIFGAGPLFPKVLDRAQVHIGFVLPICRFGGADRATMNLGRETRRHGWTPHLFVVNSGSAQLLSEFRDTFETITVIEPWELWQPDGLLGLLGTMDVVVNNLSTPTNDVFKSLRRHGIKTICHLHSVIISTHEMPSGQAYEMLRHERDVDGVIVISKKLRNWCRAWGVPREKLVLAPNAPSFEVSDEFVRTTMQVRREQSDGRPLRILYLGRFDWEKGMDRLLALHERTRSADFPVEWRIVGGRVCGSVTTTDQELEAVQAVMMPPVMRRSGLARLYAWADVVIMVSRFEGVPLTLLEAQRMGCVVLSTNVGAIEEIVESGKTGFLFSNDLDTPALVDQMVDCLRSLQADRRRLMEIAQAGADLRRQTTWTNNAKPFIDFVESLLSPAGK